MLTQVEDLNSTVSDLTHKGIDLEGQLKNLSDINSFYKEQIDAKDTIYKELNLELKEVKKANEATIALVTDRFNREATSLNEKLDARDHNYKELSLELKAANKENEVAVTLTRGKQDKELSILNERLDNRNNKYEKLRDDYSELKNRLTELQNKATVAADK